jgi:putative endonuclease
MIFYVYLIISEKNKKFFTYVGYTKDLKKRLLLHNNGKGAKYTRGKKWTIIYKKRYKSKSQAMIEEYKLKKNNIKRKKLKIEYINN